MRTILVIDDDPVLLELLAGHLQAVGYRPLLADSGPKGLQLMAEADPDLAILDVMMPGMDGWQVCARLRERTSLPIIMLTAKDQEIDKLRGFHLGVDDYVTKPFSFAELVARVGAVLARTQRDAGVKPAVTSDNLVVDLELHRVTLAGQVIDLTPTEFRLLAALARRAYRVVATETLLAEVWGPEYAGEVEHVKHYIWALRKKIETDPGDPKHILTERGFGYRFQ